MNRYFELGLIIFFLLTGFILLLGRLKFLSWMRGFLLEAKNSFDEKDRKARAQRRQNLIDFEKKNSLWMSIERQIEYSGLRRKFPELSAGRLIVIDVIAAALLFWGASSLLGIAAGAVAIVIFFFLQFGFIEFLKAKNLKAVSEELPKFLDFLGNYSLSSGEIMSIFSQISRYLKDPLRSVIEECEAESRITGDVRTALASMADKIEHPQFKQLIRNIEITSRYGADFTGLVSDSRRSLREYLSQNRDRQGMLREAGINMILLCVMSAVVLFSVNLLIGGGVAEILLHTFVGHVAIFGMAFIMILFIGQYVLLNK